MPKQTSNEDQQYLNTLMKEMNDLTQSYIKSQTDEQVQNNVNNIEEGYKRIRAYLLEQDLPPPPPQFPQIIGPQKLQAQAKVLQDIQPDVLNSYENSVPPPLKQVDLKTYMPPAKQKDEVKKPEVKKPEVKKAEVNKPEPVVAQKKDVEKKDIPEKVAKIVEKPQAPVQGTVVRYLVELSDFSEYLRYKITKKACFQKYCACCGLFTLLCLILLATSITALYVFKSFTGCCLFGGSRGSENGTIVQNTNIDYSFVKEFNDQFKKLQEQLKTKQDSKQVEAKVDVDKIIKELKQALKDSQQHIQVDSANINIDYDKIGAKVENVLQNIKQQGGNNAISKETKLELKELSEQINIITHKLDVLLKEQPAVQQIENPFQDLFDKHSIINKITDDTKLISKQKGRRQSQGIENIYKNRKKFYPGECFSIDPKNSFIQIDSVPFKAKHLIIAHPEDGDTTVGRQFVPHVVTISIKYKTSNTATAELKNAATFEFDRDGPLFQKFDFATAGLEKYEIVSMNLNFKGHNKSNDMCLYEVVVLGDFIK